MPARILIVEDQAIIAQGLSRGLKALGHEVVGVVHNGREGIGAAVELNPELVLTDIGLGEGIDGIEMASAIHECKAIPMIFLTAYTDPAILERAMKTSPYGYIVKPFEIRQVEATIRVALCRRDEEREKLQSCQGEGLHTPGKN
jgi:DNA-binding NarL/FixJ family response regulator